MSEHLSRIVALVNERFGLKLTDTDQLLFDQFEETWVADPTLTDHAKQNDLANFRLAFDRMFMNTVVTRMDANDEIFKRILDDADFRDRVADTTSDALRLPPRRRARREDRRTPSDLSGAGCTGGSAWTASEFHYQNGS